MPEDNVPWESQCADAAHEFALKCSDLKKQNPYPDTDALQYVADALMTELWDRFFSQTEIRLAFERALASLPKYAAGEERGSNMR